MTIVVGQIEPLKKLKTTFTSKGIQRFNSIGEIKGFLSNFDIEKKEIPSLVKVEFDKEIEHLNLSLTETLSRSQKNTFTKIRYFFKIRSLMRRYKYLNKNYTSILETRILEAQIFLDFTKDTVDELYPVIAGAVGENLTVKELGKLSDEFYLINDFSMEFDPPIYNRKEDDRIFSVQIDHVLVSKAGIFLLETKNWSRNSLMNLDLRSPVAQVSRTSYAFFVLLNSDSEVDLIKHHWGSARIPLRNVIVMTRYKPDEQFKHVKVLNLSELNGYIQYFDDVFTNEEVEHIFNHLCKLNG